ncbi:UNVERIFIED_CONTAM: hypothetical protein K2H54_000273 [Gekko kuhli]
MAQHDSHLRALIATEKVDLLLVENGFYGVLPLLQQRDGRRLPILMLGLSCAGFEYERPELEGLIRYVGPLLPPRIELTPPPWWERLDERPLVIVSQGTLANVDLGQLLLPAMQGLAGDELQLLLTTGGRDPARLGAAVPANAIVTEHAALAHGVPLVVAGTGEDKAEVATRVAWSGAGINLHSNEPTADAVAAAVRKLVHEPRYRARARLLADEMAVLDARAAIAEAVTALLGGQGVIP